MCIATSGPGATNLVTGLADALLDSIPMVAITGQVPRPMIGTDAFQETPIVEVTRQITKHNYLVMDIADLPRVMKEVGHAQINDVLVGGWCLVYLLEPLVSL